MNMAQNTPQHFAPLLPVNDRDEFFSMSISELAEVVEVWMKLFDQFSLESQIHTRVDSPIGRYFDGYANICGFKADTAVDELKARVPGTEAERNAKAWAMLKRSEAIRVFDDDTRRAFADLELAESRLEVTS